MSFPLLTVVVPALAERFTNGLPSSLRALFDQSQNLPVEVKCLLDNSVQTVAEKRTELTQNALGKFISSVDDDDELAPDYLAELVKAIVDHPSADVIVFDVKVTGYPSGPDLCHYSLGFDHRRTATAYYRKPNHLMAWRTDIVRAYPYKNVTNEDTEWASRVPGTTLSEARIDKVLYHYKFNPRTTTQGRVEKILAARLPLDPPKI